MHIIGWVAQGDLVAALLRELENGSSFHIRKAVQWGMGLEQPNQGV